MNINLYHVVIHNTNVTKVLCGRLGQVFPDIIIENQGDLYMVDLLYTILWLFRTWSNTIIGSK